MSITITNDFEKYNVTTGAGIYNLPKKDVDTVYGPGWPVAPVPRPEDSDIPREIDYPVTVNATLQPRIGYEGLMPVSALKSAYSNVSEVSTPVNLIIRELAGFVPMLKDSRTKQRLGDDHPYNWLTISPDRSTPFNVWLTRFKKSSKVYAAPAFFMRRNGMGDVDALEYIDGSTLFLIINSRGKLPEPNEVDPEITRYLGRIRQGIASNSNNYAGLPEVARKYIEASLKRTRQGKPLPITTPAFTQIIKGIPFSFWDKNQVYFVPEPPAPSVDSPYGETYIERSWAWIQLIALLTAFELGHYRTGNMPEGFAAMPKEWFPTMTKLALAEKEFNARMASGSQTQHARIRFGPEGMKYIPTKKPDFPDRLYATARHNIFYALGVPTSEIGERSSRGLGGKGFEQGAAHDMTRQILETEKKSIETAFNRVMLDAGVDDAVFYLDYPQEEIDPSMQQEALWNQLTHGTMTLNDVLTAQNKKVIGKTDDPNNIANMHIMVAGSSIYVLEKMKPDESGLIGPEVEAPAVGGSPINPDEEVLQDKKHTPDDIKTVKKLLQVLEEKGGTSFSEISYSLPSMDVTDLSKSHARNKCFNCDKPPTKDVTYAMAFGRIWLCTEHFTEFKSKQKGKIYVHDIDGLAPVKWKESEKLEKCPEGIDPAEWDMGTKEEQEHASTVNNDQNIINQIVLDHLNEDPKYYTHLREAGLLDSQKVDIAHDGAMVAVFIPLPVARELRVLVETMKLPPSVELETAGSMHVTLAFFPDAQTAEINKEEILNIVKSVALLYRPLECNIQGFGIFNGKDGKHVLYATLDSRDLSFIRTEICSLLDTHDILYSKDHGFVPHITLAYFTDDWQIPEGFMIPDVPVAIDGISLAIGNLITTVAFQCGEEHMGKNMLKVDWPEYLKHCGLCVEDEQYFNSPISRQMTIELPIEHHANKVEVIAMIPDGMPSKPALWKPEGGENVHIQETIGGPQFVREEAVWLINQGLGFSMVPLAYISESEGEQGAVIWYTGGNTAPRADLSSYDAECLERAAVLDYITAQCDRKARHNYFTHPDDPSKIVLIDNGFSLAGSSEQPSSSVFVEYLRGKVLSDGVLASIDMCLGDMSMWQDVLDALSTGGNTANATAAVNNAKANAQKLLENKTIT